jgi:hypothetical protein
MKKITFLVSVISFLLMYTGILRASDTPSVGAGQTGTTLSLGYDGRYLYYKEIMNNTTLDKDTGWLNGGYFELRGDNEYMFVRIAIDYTMTDSATYSGALQNGTPLSMKTRESFSQREINLGYKALNFGAATLSPYAGFGYWHWRRGENNLPDYQEDYTWWYVAVGANLACRYHQWLFGLDGAVEFPFASEMTTSIAGQVDTASFNIKSRPGFRAALPIQYRIYKDEDMNVFLFGTPYYQRWNIGASDTVVLTQGGVPVATALEPKSITEIYGIRLGLGVNF